MRKGIKRISICMAAFLLLTLSCGGGGGDSDTPVNPVLTGGGSNGGTSTGSTIGISGGVVTPTEGIYLSTNTQLTIPPNALSQDVAIELKIKETSTATFVEANQPLALSAIMAYAIDAGDEKNFHPIYTPAAIFAESTRVGLEFELLPNQTQFSTPASLEIPLSDMAMLADDASVALLLSDSGHAEVIPDVTITEDMLKLPVHHFSNVSIWKIIKNTISFVWISATMYPEDDIKHAKALVGPFVDGINEDILKALCLQKGLDPFINSGVLPSYFQLLNNLARSVGDIGGDTLALHNQLKDYILDVRLQGLPARSMAEIYAKSLELTRGDVFTALVLAHEVLRSDRFEKKYKDLIEDVRGDSSQDEVGARYHLLGTAVYGFWYEHMQNQPDPSKLVLPADFASFLEETFVSGDILSDPGEFIVDMAGAELGRNLYKASLALQNETEGLCDQYANSFEATVDIPGLPISFNPSNQTAIVTRWYDATETVAIVASEGENAESEYISMTINPNRVTGTGTVDISSDLMATGAIVLFASPALKHAVVGSSVDGRNVDFNAYDGSLTTTSWSTTAGDVVSGSFSMSITGNQITGKDDQGRFIYQVYSGKLRGSFSLTVVAANPL